MGIALIVIGVLFISTGIRNTGAQFATLITSDFTGAGSFWYFIFGIFLAGALGYYSPLQGASRLLIGLLILVFLLSNQGFFSALQSALAAPTQAPAGPSSVQPVGAPAPMTIPAAPSLGFPGLSSNPFAGLIPGL